MATVKTAISIDEVLFERGEQLADELELSRSGLYAAALQAYIQQFEKQQILQELKAVYGQGIDPEDKEFLKRAKRHLGEIVKDEEW